MISPAPHDACAEALTTRKLAVAGGAGGLGPCGPGAPEARSDPLRPSARTGLRGLDDRARREARLDPRGLDDRARREARLDPLRPSARGGLPRLSVRAALLSLEPRQRPLPPSAPAVRRIQWGRSRRNCREAPAVPPPLRGQARLSAPAIRALRRRRYRPAALAPLRRLAAPAVPPDPARQARPSGPADLRGQGRLSAPAARSRR